MTQLYLLNPTPLLRVNLPELTCLNKHLKQHILKNYSQFYDRLTYYKPPEVKEISSAGANNLFFLEQQQYFRKCEGLPALVKFPYFQKLVPHFEHYAFNFLKLLQQGELQNLERFTLNAPYEPNHNLWSRKYFWATVLNCEGSHPKHVHQECSLSGVYYVSLPQNSSCIKFHDPRGGQNPELRCSKNYPTANYTEQNPFISNEYKLYPKEGDLILFPSWMIHEVEPSAPSDYRISIAFNFVGDWTNTSNIELTSTQ